MADIDCIKDPGFKPEPIEIHDDALHLPAGLCHIETWYYDARFTNNQSMALVISVLQIGRQSVVAAGSYLYNGTQLATSTRHVYLPRRVHLSRDIPSIQVGDHHILKGFLDEDTGQWIYDINLSDEDTTMQLTLTKIAEGWKGNHPLGWWLVIPRFSVKGTITRNGKTVSVEGEGYHDHNIYPLTSPLKAQGYHFGTVGGSKLHVTWARVTPRSSQELKIFILNHQTSEPLSVAPDNLQFSILATEEDAGEVIPIEFILSVDTADVKGSLHFDTLSHHCIRLPSIRYWRYHQKITGTLTYGNVTEDIDTVEFSELLTFF
jgi:hypothetical protein